MAPIKIRDIKLNEYDLRGVLEDTIDDQWQQWIEGDVPGPCAPGPDGKEWTLNDQAEADPDNEELQIEPFRDVWNSYLWLEKWRLSKVYDCWDMAEQEGRKRKRGMDAGAQHKAKRMQRSKSI